MAGDTTDARLELSWLMGLLRGQSDNVSVTTNGPPPGFREAETFAIIPSASRPRFLVPLLSRRVASASLTSFNSLRPPGRRLARAVIGLGLRGGVVQWLLRDRVSIAVSEDVPQTRLPLLVLNEHLREVLGEREISTAIGIRGPGPFRKPVLHAFTSDGQPRGYVKIGWNDVTKALVRTEARALAKWEARPSRVIGVPRLAHHGRWQDLEITISSPLPSGVQRYRYARGLPPVEASREIAELHGTDGSILAESTYWSRLRRRVAASAGTLETRDTLHRLIERIERRYGDVPLTFGTWHGDWAPWNLAWLESKLFVWDWEHSRACVPIGFDLLHFHFQVAFIWKRRDLAETLTTIRAQAAPLLASVGVRAGAELSVFALYLLELFLRYNDAQIAGAGRNPYFYPRIVEILRAEAERLR